MKTKAFHRFLTRSAHFEADLEMVDGINLMQQSGSLYTTGNDSLFDFVDPTKHPRLSNRTNSSHNRRLAVNHLRNTIYSSYIKDLYEDMSAYFQDILKAAANNGFDPNRLIGDNKVTLDANDILSAGSWQSVIDMVAKEVFRKLENQRSTIKLLNQMDSKLGLGVDQAKIQAALPYLEIRHLLVHSDGIADDEYCTKHPQLCSTPGTKLKMNYALVSNTKSVIHDLVGEYDTKVVDGNVVSTSDLKP